MRISDLSLTVIINFEFIRNPMIGSLDVSVNVHDEIVHLKGDVDTTEEKGAIIETVNKTKGVKGIVDDITVGVMHKEDKIENLKDVLIQKLDQLYESHKANDPQQGAEIFIIALMQINKIHSPYYNCGFADMIYNLKNEAIIHLSKLSGVNSVMIAMELARLNTKLLTTHPHVPTEPKG